MATPPGGLTFAIDDGGLSAHLGMAPGIVNYFAAKALGKMFAKHRKQALAKAPGRLKELARRTIFYRGFPKGGREHLLLQRNSVDDYAKLFQKLFASTEIAAIHETGGTIRPKNAKALLVPAARLRIGRGASRRAATIADRGPTMDTFVIRGKKGNAGFLFRREGAGTPELVGLLLDKVQIQPRLGIMKRWEELKGYRTKVVGEAAAEVAKCFGNGRPLDAQAAAMLKTTFSRERPAWERQAKQAVVFGGT